MTEKRINAVNIYKIFNTEFSRMFYSKEALLSVILGMAVVLWHQILFVWKPSHTVMGGELMESAYYNWIGGNCLQIETYLFFMVIPILAVMPGGTTFFDDVRSGYIYQYKLRGAIREYIIAKEAAYFCTAALVVLIPLVSSFLFTAMRFPMTLPEPPMSLGPLAGCFDTGLYYQHPLVHTLLFMLYDIIFAGGISLFAMTGVFIFEHRFSAAAFPFLVYFFTYALFGLTGDDLSPNYFLISGFQHHFISEYIIALAILFLNALAVYWVGRKEC
ncbi:MAG: hypothetical protein VZR00_04980 [Lachnospiraceae bacterium]|jgi:hypothetical protein|nr:hypothetical protein [Lachnospiraceae bacterium]MEE3461230.1 hypothetical protein [Lachnospiraceae bacterium]